MINWVEMARQGTEGLPILADTDIKEFLRSKIEYVSGKVGKRLRIGHPDNSHNNLFSFTAEEYSSFGSLFSGIGPGKVKSDYLQTLGLEIMKEYGLDEGVSYLDPKYRNHVEFRERGGTFNNGDGTLGQVRLYPSKTLKGLVFERVQKISATTNKILSVSWSVRDEAPLFRINLGRK
jgi:hypothetical protein